ncbi:MAG: BPSL0067 family protein, partial [Cyanobacteria bacterium P01_D01_bin.116]
VDGTFQNPISSSVPFTKKNGWTNNNDHPRTLADVNGDGRADIVGFGNDAVFTSFASVAPQGLMATPDKLAQLMNGQLNGRSFNVDKAYGAQCWDLVAYATGINSSSPYWNAGTWKRGVSVMATGNIAVGTAIATFLGPNATYYSNSGNHTAIFAGYGSENGVSGFYVWDQNWGQRHLPLSQRYVQRHFIRSDRWGTSDADNYYLIQA